MEIKIQKFWQNSKILAKIFSLGLHQICSMSKIIAQNQIISSRLLAHGAYVKTDKNWGQIGPRVVFWETTGGT